MAGFAALWTLLPLLAAAGLAERFGPPRTSGAEAASPEGAAITFPGRRPARRTPWPPPTPVPVAPCPAGTGIPQ